MAKYDKGFLGNVRIRAAATPIQWDEFRLSEFRRCAEDPQYFFEHYVYIKNVDQEELILFKPRSYQIEMLNKMLTHRNVIVKLPRQCGKTTLTAAVLLWHLIFHRNFSILIAAHKGDKARDVLTNVKEMYENLPEFLQHGVESWNKGSIQLETGSRIRATATSGSAARGDVYNCVAGETLVTVREISTGKVEEIEIKELHERLKTNSWRYIEGKDNPHVSREQVHQDLPLSMREGEESWNHIRADGEGHLYEILSENGVFYPFDGVKMTKAQSVVKLVLVDGRVLIVTPGHEIQTRDGWKRAGELTLGDEILTKTGYVSFLSSECYGQVDVFDPINVNIKHSFQANEIIIKNCVYLDEFAFVAKHIAEEFVKSVIPTVSSGKTTKIFITSTPKGLNMFYDMWSAATHPEEDKRSGYAWVEIKWNDVPGRDEAFRKSIIAQFGQEYFDQEYGAEFLGSSRTLISGAKLVSMANHIIQPIEQNQTTRIYKKAQKGHSYAMTVDVSEGLGGDYSAIVVFDITELPYEIVAVFKTNEMHPMALPGVIFDMAQTYNEPLVLVEANFGQQVGEILYSDLEYENVVFTTKGKTGPQAKVDRISAGFGNRNRVGIAWSKNSKRVGCTNLKTLIEQDQLFVPCSWIYEELKRFVVVKESYAGEDGHDDLAMCLVMFGWMCDQGYVRDATDVHLRGKIKDLNQALIEEEMFPLGWTVRAGEADEGFEPIHIVRPPAIDMPNLETGEPHPWNDLFNQARSRGGMTEAQLHDKFIMELFNQGPPRPSDE